MDPLIYGVPLALVGLSAAAAYGLSRMEPGSRQRVRRRQAASPLAHELPYWHATPGGVLVGVDLSYSAALELVGVDTDCLSADELDQVARALHAALHVLPHGTLLQWLHITDRDHSALADAFTGQTESPSPVAQRLTRERAQMIRRDPNLRRTRLYLVVTRRYGRARLPGGRRFADWTEREHATREREILSLREQVARGLEGAGLDSRELSKADAIALAYEMLNPARARTVPAPAVGPRLDVADEQTLREQLAFAGVAEQQRHLTVDGRRLRVLTLKNLPAFTEPALLETLTVALPYEVTVQLGLEVLDDQKSLDALKRKRDRALALAQAAQRRNQEAEAQHIEVAELIDENLYANIRMVRLSLTVVLGVTDGSEADRQLDEQTSEVLRLLSRAHGADGLVEDYAQLDTWLSTLPGNVAHAGRWHTCTSQNAGHLLLAFQSWPGHRRPSVMLENRRNHLVGFDPFDGSLDNPNAFMAGASGAGKSVTTNFLLMHLLASGAHALVIDVGGSYRKLIELFGGDYLSFEREADPALNLFYPPEDMFDEAGSIDPLRMQFILTVLEALATDGHRPELRHEERAVLDSALGTLYRHYAAYAHTPLLGEFVAYLATVSQDESWRDDEDRGIARQLAKRLGYWTQGAHGQLFNRPSTVQLTSLFAGFDLKGLSDEVREPVVLILSGLIWNLVMKDASARKLVVFDEVWTLLSTPASAKLLEELYRTSRKYRCAILSISQSVDDFTGSSIAGALVNNSATAYLLRHRSGHAQIAEHFQLNPRERQVFEELEMRRGAYAELLMLAGAAHHFVARIALTPLEYWIATTHPADKAAHRALAAEHPHLGLLDTLHLCAQRWPRGVEA